MGLESEDYVFLKRGRISGEVPMELREMERKCEDGENLRWGRATSAFGPGDQMQWSALCLLMKQVT